MFICAVHVSALSVRVYADDGSENDSSNSGGEDHSGGGDGASDHGDSSDSQGSNDNGGNDQGSTQDGSGASGGGRNSGSGGSQSDNGKGPVGSSDKAMPLQRILDQFNHDVGALVVDVQLVKVRHFQLYQIKSVDKSGTVKLTYYYARSGRRVKSDSGK